MKFRVWLTYGLALILFLLVGIIILTNYQARADGLSGGCKTAAFYSEKDFNGSGSYGCFPLGGFTSAYLKYFNLVGNISSVEVAPEYKIMLFSQDLFKGDSITVKSDISDLQTLNFYKKALSVRVLKFDDPELLLNDEMLNCDAVSVYSASNYGDLGNAGCFEEGSYSEENLESYNLGGNISSIKIPAGYKITLYDNSDFSGRSLELVSDTPNLAIKNFANITSSLKVEKVSSCSLPLTETKTEICPNEKTGTITKTRQKNSAPTCDWGAWGEVENHCEAGIAESSAAKRENNTTGIALTGLENKPNQSFGLESVPDEYERPSISIWTVIIGLVLITGLIISIYFLIIKRPKRSN